MQIKVLVSGAGGDVAQGVMKALLSSRLDILIYTTCISRYSAWLYKPEVQGFIVPPSSHKDYIDFMIRLINKLDIQVFIPTVDSEILRIADNRERIEADTNAKVFVGGYKSVRVCDDKLRTVSFLRKNGFRFPDTSLAIESEASLLLERVGFPLILKPRTGGGSRHVRKIHNMTEFEECMGNEDQILQEWLDPSGGEYTSGIYIGDDAEVKGICTFKRILKGGSTVVAERIIRPDIDEQLTSIAIKLDLKYVNIQSMMSGDTIIPFEFNGRLSGSTAMVAKVFNAPELYIREKILGHRIEKCSDDRTFVALRYFEEIYTSIETINKMHKEGYKS